MSRPTVAVLDSGIGNVYSMHRATFTTGGDPQITKEPEDITKADILIIPGVGSFPAFMEYLESNGLEEAIRSFASTGRPILGVCLGMHILFGEGQEAGTTRGVGLLEGKVVALPKEQRGGKLLRKPHMGWSSIRFMGNESATLFQSETTSQDTLYFAHSFVAVPTHQELISADFSYGGYKFPAIVEKENVVGVQFHPERSGRMGLRMLAHFLAPRKR